MRTCKCTDTTDLKASRSLAQAFAGAVRERGQLVFMALGHHMPRHAMPYSLVALH